jgi:hypothetical protein
MENTPFTKEDSTGWYVCGCGFSTVFSKVNDHMSTDFVGYCKEGVRKGRNTEYQCICGAEFSCWESMEKHVLDKEGKCVRSALNYKGRTCSICDLEFRVDAELKRHLLTKKHIEKSNGTYKDIELFCKTCNISCLSRNLMEKHLSTNKHVQRKKEGTLNLTCEHCNITCRGQNQMKTHLATNKHKKNEKLKQNMVSSTNNGVIKDGNNQV